VKNLFTKCIAIIHAAIYFKVCRTVYKVLIYNNFNKDKFSEPEFFILMSCILILSTYGIWNTIANKNISFLLKYFILFNFLPGILGIISVYYFR